MPKFSEPVGDEVAGLKTYKAPPSPYETWMAGEGIPIVRGFGVHNVRDLELGDWRRRNARGAFLHLFGIEHVKGMYVLQIPGREITTPERHMYDEFFYVVEGRGNVEVWVVGGGKHVFEWQAGSLFMIPINANYRLINASGSDALLLASTNAPVIMNIFQSTSFIFENDWVFGDRYNIDEKNFFSPSTDLEPDPVRGRASIRSNLFPDIVRAQLPLDNQRAPGYRRIKPHFTGFVQDARAGGFISEYPSGRYSKGHYHPSGAVLVCLKGKGYTLNWPQELGPTPWQDGHADQVNRTEYVAGGLVAAAPGGGHWFHQHFGVCAEGLRVLNFWGGPTEQWGQPDKPATTTGEVKAGNLFGISEGGRTIMYWEEDPFIREYYRERLAAEGLEMTMPESAFRQPDDRRPAGVA